MSQDELRRLLQDAVPDLPAPEDRLASVGARVRRTRRRFVVPTAIAAAAAAGLAIGVPQFVRLSTVDNIGPSLATPGPVPTPPPVDKDSCPTVAAPDPSTNDRPGPLVGSDAASVTLCERATGLAGPNGPPVGAPRTLTTGVDQIVDRLNSLPNADEFLARMREQERKVGHDANNLELGCTLIGFATEFSLSLRYPDGSITVVWLYQNCGTASSGGRTRYGDVRSLFLTLYRAQLEATANPASVPAPTCPSHLTRADLTMAPGGKHPLEEIARNRSGENPFLPSPLAKANVCRYHKATGGSATLVKSDAVSDPERLRTMLNAATIVQTTTDERGASSATNFADCFGADLGIADVLDLLRIADITGAIAELFILRGSCAAVVRYGMGGLVPTPELTAALDARLGRP